MEKHSDILQPNKTKIAKYKRPEFVLLFLTGFLWLAFLFKVFFITEAKEPLDALMIHPMNQKKIPVAAKSRNKKSINKTEIPAVVEAVRESFQKTNPRPNDQIIRGEISEIVSPEEQPKKPVEDLSAGILKMLNDSFEMKSLNKDYKQALQGEEDDLEKKIFYQGRYY